VIPIELRAGFGPRSHAVGVRVPTPRKLREEWGTQSIGDINEVKIWGTQLMGGALNTLGFSLHWFEHLDP